MSTSTPSKPPKLTDVARSASVDIATASRALNRSPGWERLSAACVERVEQAARALGYRPNAAARGLRRRRADAVGILHSPGRDGSVWMRELFDGLESALFEQGLHAVLIAGEAPVETAAAFAAEGRIDGLIAPVYALDRDARRALARAGVPHVVTHVAPDAAEGPAVALDAAAGIREAVAHLAALGHRHLLWASPDPGRSNDASPRGEACREACRAHGLRLSEVLAGGGETRIGRSIATATEALIPLLRSADRPSAIVAYHDPIALGALCAARRLGLRVPADLSVTGFDDSFGEVADPPLTSVSHAPLEIARAAVGLFLELREN
ncbi:MAG: LacI family DNA-binding transcriptional regulator, partial [Puniceicoccaceae bacterium]